MARRQAAQLELEMQEDPPVEPPTPAPRRARARSEGRPGWRVRFRRILIWTGAGVGVIAAIVGAYQVDQFMASDAHFILPGGAGAKENPYFQVSGLEYAPREEVMRVFAHDFGRSVYLLPLGERRRSLLAIDWVRDATISRQWPNRVVVWIKERQPVAFVTLPRKMAGGWTVSETALIDAEGVILRPPQRARFSLPVLTGVTRQEDPGIRRARVSQVVDLIRQVHRYAAQISEIDVGDPDNLVVTGVAQGRAVRLLLGDRNYLWRLSTFMDHYTDISRRLPNARTFDLRLDDHITAQDGGANGR
jgi:cell division protein FtsQ